MKPKTIANYLDAVYDKRITIHDAQKEIFELFMSCVPEEKNVDTANNAVANSNYYGFNTCRNQMIKNLEKLK